MQNLDNKDEMALADEKVEDRNQISLGEGMTAHDRSHMTRRILLKLDFRYETNKAWISVPRC